MSETDAPVIVKPVKSSDPDDTPYFKKSYRYLPLPRAVDRELEFYAVRLEGQEGTWPAFAFQTEVFDVDPDKPRLYPAPKPGERFPLKAYEQPIANIRHNKDGSPRKHEVRAWRRADDHGVWFHEHPGAAVLVPWPRVVEVFLWCPMRSLDEHGFIGDHGKYWAVDDERVPENRRTGFCRRCEKDPEIQKHHILRRIKKLRGEI